MKMLSDQTIGHLTTSLEMETIPQTMERVLGQFQRIPYTLKFSRVTVFQVLVLDSHQIQTLSHWLQLPENERAPHPMAFSEVRIFSPKVSD